jgi:hypothetical protein
MVITSAILILGTCCLAALFVLLKAWRLRTSIYRYDVSSDQHYDFQQSRSSRITSRLLNGRLDIPSSPQAGDAIWLELRIRSTLLGRWFEPYIELQSTHGRFRQPFERGGSGLRYVELSRLGLDHGASLRLTGH